MASATQSSAVPGFPDANAYAIGAGEGGTGSNRYSKLGVVIPKTGDRAYGAYQVMGANIGPWTKEILGQEMTPQEFLASPAAQDAVFKGKFGQYTDKYGPQGAAAMWFSGKPKCKFSGKGPSRHLCLRLCQRLLPSPWSAAARYWLGCGSRRSGNHRCHGWRYIA